MGKVLIALALVLLTWLLLSMGAHAEQRLSVEAGAAVLRGESPSIGLTDSICCGPAGTRWELGADYVGDWPRNDETQNVIQLRAQITRQWGRFGGGAGFYWLNAETGYVCQFGLHLLARWQFSGRLAAQWRHSSSGGSCEPNSGLDVVSLGYRF